MGRKRIPPEELAKKLKATTAADADIKISGARAWLTASIQTGKFTIHWSVAAKGNSDWVGLYPPGHDPEDYRGYLTYADVGGETGKAINGSEATEVYETAHAYVMYWTWIYQTENHIPGWRCFATSDPWPAWDPDATEQTDETSAGGV